jgi:hypothetical protein
MIRTGHPGCDLAASASARPAAAGVITSRACPPSGLAMSFSDSLDKLVYNGVERGGVAGQLSRLNVQIWAP